MKFTPVLFFSLLLLPASIAFAHGGSQRVSTSTIVTYFQTPISPLVGEKVGMTFSITDKNLTSIPGIHGTLSLTESFSSKESDDKVIVKQPFVTDSNGDFSYSYTFPHAHYYDVDLDYTDPAGTPQNAGFLIQPRSVPQINTRQVELRSFLLGVILSALIAGAIFFYRRRSSLR